MTTTVFKILLHYFLEAKKCPDPGTLFSLENVDMIELFEETLRKMKEESDIVVQICGDTGRTLSFKKDMCRAIMKGEYPDDIVLNVIKCILPFMRTSTDSAQLFEMDNVVAQLISQWDDGYSSVCQENYACVPKLDICSKSMSLSRLWLESLAHIKDPIWTPELILVLFVALNRWTLIIITNLDKLQKDGLVKRAMSLTGTQKLDRNKHVYIPLKACPETFTTSTLKSFWSFMRLCSPLGKAFFNRKARKTYNRTAFGVSEELRID